MCFGPVIVHSPVHVGAYFHLENKLIGQAYDSTLMGVVSSPGVIVIVAE